MEHWKNVPHNPVPGKHRFQKTKKNTQKKKQKSHPRNKLFCYFLSTTILGSYSMGLLKMGEPN